MNPITALFGELRPGDEFYSPRTERRICTKLDQCYQDKSGRLRELNAFVEGDELGNPTLASFEANEKVEMLEDELGIAVSIKDLFRTHQEARRIRALDPNNREAFAAQGYLTNIFLDLEEEITLPDSSEKIIGPFLEKARSGEFK